MTMGGMDSAQPSPMPFGRWFWDLYLPNSARASLSGPRWSPFTENHTGCLHLRKIKKDTYGLRVMEIEFVYSWFKCDTQKCTVVS